MHESLERIETRYLASGSPGRDADPSENEISRGQAGEGAEDDDGGEPMQRDLVKVIPGPPGGLNEHACASRWECRCALRCAEIAATASVRSPRWRPDRPLAAAGRRPACPRRRSRRPQATPTTKRARANKAIIAHAPVGLRQALVVSLATSHRDPLAIGGLPAPRAGAVTALDHALLVDLGNDLAVAREQ